LIASAGINILDTITEFHNKTVGANSSVKLLYFSLGKGLEDMVNEGMAKAAQSGDWIILENLHLADDWLPSFEERMSKWKGAEMNPKFRVWITCIPVENFPVSILERSIKVALQSARNIKSKVQRMLIEQEKETYFRKSGKHS
jgi:dynein heavy chain, axonemal